MLNAKTPVKDYGECERPMCEGPASRNITNDLCGINCRLNEIENIVETLLYKIDGGSENRNVAAPKEPTCISELLEDMRNKADRICGRIDQINSFI